MVELTGAALTSCGSPGTVCVCWIQSVFFCVKGKDFKGKGVGKREKFELESAGNWHGCISNNYDK